MSTAPRQSRSRKQVTSAAHPLKDDNKENDPYPSNAKSGHRDKLEIDAIAEELEQKYNIEGSNTLDIIYARQENDAAQAKIAAQAAQLEDLTRQLAAMKAAGPRDGATVAPAAAPVTNDEDEDMADATDAAHASGMTNTTAGGSDDEDDPMGDGPADALARENAKLKQQLAEALARAGAGTNDAAGSAPTGNIPRPPGTAGTHFNIRNAMGLGKTAKDGDQYLALLRNMRDLTLQAGINWEVPWAKMSAEAKGKLFAVPRERHPILKRFHNDWATEEMVKQYIKNRRNMAYRRGDLDVPEKYRYLKGNAAKRDPSAPHGRKAKLSKAKVAAVKKSLQKKAKVVQKNKSGKASGNASSGGSKPAKKSTAGKKRAVVVDSDEDDDDEMLDVERSEGSDGE
ncbi:hypothetical protein B0H11DRAFT_2240829 [Mycena galericulata]|nr:hypothetical protein B0H11DRAFT_2240829 [Mycena galericulata]